MRVIDLDVMMNNMKYDLLFGIKNDNFDEIIEINKKKLEGLKGLRTAGCKIMSKEVKL